LWNGQRHLGYQNLRIAMSRADTYTYAMKKAALFLLVLAAASSALGAPKPKITSPPTSSGTIGVPYSYQITADQAITTWGAAPLPAGLTVNTSTGLISGTPTVVGVFSVTLSATNGNGTGTLVLTLTIGNPVPRTTSISPSSCLAGSPQFTLTVNGTNFVSSSSVRWNGSALSTTFVSATQLTAIVPAANVATAGTTLVTVVNPAPGGGTSNAQTFTINNPVPTTTSISPSSCTAGSAQFTLTVNGTNFVSTSMVNWNGTALTTTFVSSTQLTAIVTAALVASPGTASVTVVNSSPGGGTSNAQVFTICPAAPVINSRLTDSATWGSPYSYQITASGNPTSFNATPLPAGLSVNTTTGLISGAPTAVGTFNITISASNSCNGANQTGNAMLVLTITYPPPVPPPPFPGQLNVFDWGPTPPDTSTATIPFPQATTDNNFVLYWNLNLNQRGPPTNPRIADSANGGLQRNADSVGMRYNPYDPTNPNSTPAPNKNVWRGNPNPPNDNTLGQFADPRASWYITDPWPTADYVTGSYWAGPNPNMIPLNWPDSGHPFSYTGVQPSGPGQYPTDIMAGPTPTPDPSSKSISLLSTSDNGVLASITELANVWDPAQLTYSVTYQDPERRLPDIPNTATRSARGAGGHTLAIGRPEFSMFDQNGMRAWQLLDVFSGKTINNNFTNTAGLVNINTASRDVLRALAAGILENRDSAIQPASLQGNLYPPTSNAVQSTNVRQADKFADAVINSRPVLSTAALSAIRDCGQNIPCNGQLPRPFFGNPNQYENSTQTPPTEWNDPGREELFAKIYNLTTTRSRNFRVFVTGQSLDKNGNVLSTVTKVYHVFIKPNRDPTTGAIRSQQVQIKYEGSM
jgi:hypothetical protein